MSTIYRIFAVVTPNLEPLLESELDRLNIGRQRKPDRGGMHMLGSAQDLWRTCLEVPLVESVRVRIGRFKAHNFPELISGVSKLPWAAYLPRGFVPIVRASCRKSALYHSTAVEKRVTQAISERLQAEGNRTKPGGLSPMVFVRLLDDMVTVSVDASGALLHKRGYRLRVGKAPLRETLASACIKTANFRGNTPLWDPFCGSGTIAVEAARQALEHPNTGRPFAFESWPTHNSEAFDRLKKSLTPSVSQTCPIFASDREKKETDNARQNAKNANLSTAITLSCGDFEDQGLQIPPQTTIITNLPYGHRTSKGADLWDTFKRFGAFLDRRKDLGPVWVLNGQPGFSRATGLKWSTALKFKNQGLDVALLKLKRQA